MIGLFRTPRPEIRAIPGVTAPARTDLPVLTPAAEMIGRKARRERADGFRLKLSAWHGLALFFLFLLFTGIAAAQVDRTLDQGVLATLWRWIPLIVGHGFVLNLIISFTAMAIGTAAGVMLGLGQISLLPQVRGSSWLTTQLFRNSPWLVLLFCVMLLLPFEITIGDVVIRIPDWIKATIGFSLPIMANISELVRGAVQSIPSGQWEASESLAFTRRQTLWQIILPQCVKRMIPPWMNWYAILTMATPICSIMGVQESVNLTQQALVSEDSRPELLAPFYLFLLLIFFCYCYPIARWTIHLERKYAVKI